MPFLAMHMAVDRQVPVLKIGLLWTAVGICSSVTQWVSGQIADRIGRRRVMLAAMVLRSANLAALGWAIGADAAFGTIAALCLVNGAMRAFYDPAASAVVAALAVPDERVAAFSLHRVGSSIGWAAGPLSATLASGASYETLFYVAAPLTLLAALAVATIPETRPDGPRAPLRLRLPSFSSFAKDRPFVRFLAALAMATIPEPLPDGPRAPLRLRLPSFSSFAKDRPFVRFLAATFAFYLLQTQMYHIMSIYAAKHLGLDRAQVGTLFVLNGILVVLIQLPAVRYIRLLGNRGAKLLGALGYTVAYTGCALATGYLPLLACVALVTLSEIVAVPAQQATVTELGGDKVTRYAGMYGFVQGAAQTAGPILGTCLIEFVSPQGAWLMLAAIGLLAAWGYRTRVAI